MRKHNNGNMVAEKAQGLYSASSKLARKGSSRIKSFIQGRPVVSIVTGVVAVVVLALAFRPRK